MKSFHLYALITILCWSVGNTFTKIAVAYFSPCPLAALRYAVAFAAFIVIAFSVKMKLPQKRDIPWFIVAGATGFFGFTLAFNKGCETVTASTASVILAAVPVMTGPRSKAARRISAARCSFRKAGKQLATRASSAAIPEVPSPTVPRNLRATPQSRATAPSASAALSDRSPASVNAPSRSFRPKWVER